MPYDLLVILGPTACGKTKLAAQLAYRLDGEIISADSRQVYRRMDLGTGKDLSDYYVHGKHIPAHLIDIAEPGDEYNVYTFQRDFAAAVSAIESRKKFPILCGGTGMYLESVVEDYEFLEVPYDDAQRKMWDTMSVEDLIGHLVALRPLHATTDITQRERLYRALEIAQFQQDHPRDSQSIKKLKPLLVGVHMDRSLLRNRITQRLRERIDGGMIDEVRRLLEEGVPEERFIAYGLEYKYVVRFLRGELDQERMFTLLNTAIHQFAKRQMTWYRRMERKGHPIHWIDGTQDEEEKVSQVLKFLKT